MSDVTSQQLVVFSPSRPSPPPTARHFCDRLIGRLSLIWSDMAGIELSVAGLDSHMETAQIVPVSEPTMTLMMEARLDGALA